MLAAAAAVIIAKPDVIGCGQLKLVALHPDSYDVRPELFQQFTAALCDELWAADAPAREGLP